MSFAWDCLGVREDDGILVETYRRPRDLDESCVLIRVDRYRRADSGQKELIGMTTQIEKRER